MCSLTRKICVKGKSGQTFPLSRLIQKFFPAQRDYGRKRVFIVFQSIHLGIELSLKFGRIFLKRAVALYIQKIPQARNQYNTCYPWSPFQKKIGTISTLIITNGGFCKHPFRMNNKFSHLLKEAAAQKLFQEIEADRSLQKSLPGSRPYCIPLHGRYCR